MDGAPGQQYAAWLPRDLEVLRPVFERMRTEGPDFLHNNAALADEVRRTLADRCILKSKPMVRKIMAALGLPKGTRVAADSHYKCAVCMGKVPTRKQEHEDWDF